MRNKLLYRLLAMLLVYGLLKFFGGSFGRMALYPVTLFVTFLHEFGHALAAILTGGGVEGVQINPDGGGYTKTIGGNRGVVLMGGYLGSAVLGNLLFFIGARKKTMAKMALYTLAIIMAFVGVLWFESFVSSGILLGFAISLYMITKYTNWDQDVLMFLGLAAVLYIIQDFNVGPKSDLAMYEQEVGFLSSQAWMFIWLGIAALLFYFNLRNIFKGSRSVST
jgi:Peptidase M50B-like